MSCETGQISDEHLVAALEVEVGVCVKGVFIVPSGIERED